MALEPVCGYVRENNTGGCSYGVGYGQCVDGSSASALCGIIALRVGAVSIEWAKNLGNYTCLNPHRPGGCCWGGMSVMVESER